MKERKQPGEDVKLILLFNTEMRRPPYYTNYSRSRLLIHNVVTSKYFDLAIAAVIGLNVVTMAMEFYLMPPVRTSDLGSFFLLINLESNVFY